MEYNETLEKINVWINVVQKSLIVLAVIETIIVLIIGVASSNIYHEKYSTFWITILVTLGIIYLILTVIKIAYNKSFPASIVEELKAKRELEISIESITRKDAINNYISNTIVLLNKCKCTIPKLNEGDNWEIDSDEDFIKGIKSITFTFNNILNILLNTSNIKFTTGIYVDDFRAINHHNAPENNKGTFLMRDDFELSESGIIRNLMIDENQKQIGLEIQNAIKISFNNGKFYVQDIETSNNKKISLICSNIRDLDDSKIQKGVLFIITQQINTLPIDLESTLTTFSNIISHWLDLYEHKVIQRQIEFITDEEEEERLELEQQAE